MKAVIQRVLSASATVDGQTIASIGPGLCVLLGISRDDKSTDADYIIKKILNTRLFEDESGKRWNKSITDVNCDLLILSQVTLYHKFKGNKLDFHTAMSPEEGRIMFDKIVDDLGKQYNKEKVKCGQFGAYSVINIVNDGPVTIVLESNKQTSDT